jgi:hypothetical protein
VVLGYRRDEAREEPVGRVALRMNAVLGHREQLARRRSSSVRSRLAQASELAAYLDAPGRAQ